MVLQVQTSLETFAPLSVLEVLTDSIKQQLALHIARDLRIRWLQLAKASLTTQLRDYQNAIQEERLDGQAAVVSLLGDDANRIEHGLPPFDMRTTLLGPNVPVVAKGSGMRGKRQSTAPGGGYYRSIPFRHQTPGSSKSPSSMSHAKTMGHAYVADMGKKAAAIMGKAVYAAAKKLSPSTTEPHRLAGQATAKVGEPPAGNRRRQRLAKMNPLTRWGQALPAGVGGVQKLKAHHTTDIYAGMRKMQDTYRKTKQSYYVTFRTISTRKTTGWHLPGTQGVNLMQKLQQELPEIGHAVLSHFIESAQGANAP